MLFWNRAKSTLTRLFPKSWFLNTDGSFRSWMVPAILLGLASIAHGLFITRLGYYWDDWGFAWPINFRGGQALRDVFNITRPMQGYVEAFLGSILGTNIVIWQLFSLTMRWLATLFLWLFLNRLWPLNRQLNFIVALFFLVYPGFTQQPIALTYNYFWIFEAIFFASLIFMIRSIEKPKLSISFLLASLGLSLLALFSIEYLFGLELVRPIFIWLALGKRIPVFKKRLLRTITYYLPYLVAMAAYLFWRFRVYNASIYQPLLLEELKNAPIPAFLDLLQTVAKTFFVVTFQAWIQVFQLPPGSTFSQTMWAVYVVVLLATFLGLLIFLARFHDKEKGTNRLLAWTWIVIGILLILCAGIPYYIAKLPIQLSFPDDHYTLPFMFGISLFLAGIFGLFPLSSQRITVSALLVALAVGLNIYSNNEYRSEWQRQQNFIWQLTWRAPALKPGTVIVTEDMDTFPYDDDEALSYAIAWAYDPLGKNEQMPYAYFFASARLGNSIPSFQSGQTIQYNYVFEKFISSTDHVIFLEYNPPSCVHILTSEYDLDRISVTLDSKMPWRQEKASIRMLPELAYLAIPLSNLNQVETNPTSAAAPPQSIFGQEPKHQWCYYYEKADLARQIGDWEEVVQIADEVFAIPYYPDDYYEYLLFVDGYVRVQRYEDAQSLTDKIIEAAPVLRPALCAIWQDAGSQSPVNKNDQAIINTEIHKIGICPLP